MGYHQYSHPVFTELFKDIRQLKLKEIVNPLGWLIKEQYLRSCQQYFGKGSSLLLAPGKVVRVTVEQMSYVAYTRNSFHISRVITGNEHFLQIFSDRLFYEQALRILRQHGEIAFEKFIRSVFFHTLAFDQHLTAIRSAYIAYGFESSGFAGSVASDYGKDLSLRHIETDAL